MSRTRQTTTQYMNICQYAHTSVCYTVLTSTRWHALSLPATAVCVLCFCFLRLFAALLIQLTWDKKKQTTTKSRQGAHSKRRVRCETCMCIMLRRRGHGIITLQWPASSACDLSLSIYFRSPFSCCGDNSTKAYTQTNTNCRQAKEHEGQTANISHLTRPAEPCARNHPSLTASS